MAENRFEVRKRATHEQIKEATLGLILDSGLASFCLDDAADAADVSRATVFNHFHSKESLVQEVVGPLFSMSLDNLIKLVEKPGPVYLSDVAAFCLGLWREHCERLGFAGESSSLHAYPALSSFREAFRTSFTRLMERVGETTGLRNGDPVLCAELAFRCFVPLLTAVADRPDAERLFGECLSDLLMEAHE